MAAVYSFSSGDLLRAFVANGIGVRARVDGDVHRIRCDFPVDILADGVPISVRSRDSESFQPNPGAIGSFVLRRPVKEFTIKHRTDWGSTYALAVGRYGMVSIESVSLADDLELLPIDPRDLPSHTYYFFEDTGVTQLDIVQSDHPFGAEWTINGRLPRAFYLASVSVCKRESGNPSQANPHYALADGTTEITCFRQANGGASEREDLFSVAGMGAYTVSFPFLKIPLASLLSPWQAESPTIAFEYTENRTTSFQSQIQTKLTGAVLW